MKGLNKEGYIVSQINENDIKFTWNGLQISSSSTVFSRFGLSDLFLFLYLNKLLAGMKFTKNEEVIFNSDPILKQICVKSLRASFERKQQWLKYLQTKSFRF